MASKDKSKKKVGRPCTFDKDKGLIVCERLAGGESLRSICKDVDMPNKDMVIRWVLMGLDGEASEDLKKFSIQYARAREIQIEGYADECSDIADDGSNDWMIRYSKDGNELLGWQLNGEHVQRSRLRIDTRKWFASKIIPKKYGDKITQELTGKDGTDLIPTITVNVRNKS